jgi:Cys-tRNA(Pro)/Cys-tRNA(Cys) deacylase
VGSTSRLRLTSATSFHEIANLLPVSNTAALTDSRLVAIEHQVVRHGSVKSLEEAAELRGVSPSAVIKTMVVRKGDNDYVFVLVPGDRVIDWPKLRSLLDERRLSMPDAQEALGATGYERGTITPFGSSHPWPVIADTRVSSEMVSIGGGAHGVSVTVDGMDLCLAVDADIADVTRERSKQ